MSWQNDIQNIKFEVITGDKKIYYPKLVQMYEKNVSFNGTQYDFVNRDGSFFDRKLPRGRSYQLEFCFTGENNVKNGNAFEKSARVAKPWTVIHPFYGKIVCQPIDLKQNNTALDTTRFSSQVIETIVARQPESAPNYDYLIAEKQALAKSTQLAEIKRREITLTAKNRQLMTSSTKASYDKIGGIISKAEDEYATLKSYYKNCQSVINSATGAFLDYTFYAQKLVTLPSTLAANVGSRWNMLENNFDYLIKTIEGIPKPSYFEKVFTNLMGGICVQSMANTLTVKNTGDLQTRAEINLYIDKLVNVYAKYKQFQDDYEDELFIPDSDYSLNLQILIALTVGSLYELLQSGKQERYYTLEKDNNIIVLAHKFYGDLSEENIELLKSSNKLGLNELFNIKKGRELIYYV